jgi:nicotinamidase-related amidase
MSDAPHPTHRDRWTNDGSAVSLLRDRPAPRPLRLAAEPEPVVVDLARSALVIIDMQNDFLRPEGWFAETRGVDVSPLSKVIPAINALSGAFRAASVPVIHINWAIRPDVANLPANVLDKGSSCGARPGYGDEIAAGPVLVRDEWGSKSVDEIETAPTDIFVGKHRLTGFRDNELDAILRRLGVDTLFFTGVNLDRCVFATLADGCFGGFDAVLVEDATTTVSPPYVTDAILYLIRLLYGFTTRSADLLPALSSLSTEGSSQ